MRIGSGGSQDINTLQSDAAQFRNEDFVVDKAAAFMETAGQAAVAAEYSHVQLWNPVGSAIVSLVDGIIFKSNTTQDIYLRDTSTIFGALDSNWSNMKLGAADGITDIRTGTNAAIQGDALMILAILADTVIYVPLTYAFNMAAGEGLLVVAGTVNTKIAATYIGREV